MGCLKPFWSRPDQAGFIRFSVPPYRRQLLPGREARSCTWSIAAKYRITSAARRARSLQPIIGRGFAVTRNRLELLQQFSTDRAPSVGICSTCFNKGERPLLPVERGCRNGALRRGCASHFERLAVAVDVIRHRIVRKVDLFDPLVPARRSQSSCSNPNRFSVS